MPTPDSTFLSFSSNFLTGSQTVRRVTDADGVQRIYVGIRLVPEIQLQNLSDGSAKPTVVFKIEQSTAALLWPLMSASLG